MRPAGAVQPLAADVTLPREVVAPDQASGALLQRLASSGDPGIAFAALTLSLGRPAEAPDVRGVRAAIPGSSRARALLCGRAADGTIPLHPYAKWQGSHWTLVQLALLGYPPGDEELLPLRELIHQLGRALVIETQAPRRRIPAGGPDRDAEVAGGESRHLGRRRALNATGW
jgi:hypothetical protein